MASRIPAVKQCHELGWKLCGGSGYASPMEIAAGKVRLAWPRLGADARAGALVALLAAVTLSVGSAIGLTTNPPLWLLMAVPTGLLVIAGYYAAFRQAEHQLFQMAFYIALWIAFPLIGVRLTYLGAVLAFPLQDSTFAAADAALGFDWASWSRAIAQKDFLYWSTRVAYATSYWQPFVIVLILALFGRREDNARLMIAMVISLLITMIPHTFWPSVGPAPSHGLENRWNDVVMTLRAGHPENLPYVGIITFPSFHATMATLFTLAYRNVPAAMIAAGIVNFLMLLSIPYPGGHYFLDVPAGILIALLAYRASAKLTG